MNILEASREEEEPYIPAGLLLPQPPAAPVEADPHPLAPGWGGRGGAAVSQTGTDRQKWMGRWLGTTRDSRTEVEDSSFFSLFLFCSSLPQRGNDTVRGGRRQQTGRRETKRWTCSLSSAGSAGRRNRSRSF